ncbi:MAG: tRNA epoxyqueuosine(34) reductase QueG [Rhodospirillaceae bacterium]|nr:tRNA epoxyqueuosine(34) reductase QueG [Rhodospirillaceae bacterium]
MTPPPDREAIRAFARGLGFDVVRFAPAETRPDVQENLRSFMAQEIYGDMGWMAANADRRADPKVLWPDVKTAVMLGLNYGPSDEDVAPRPADAGVISVYARNNDYHDVIKKKLRQFAIWIAENTGADVKLFVDTAPVMEKPLAQSAGVGWQGKHTNVVSREFGSWLFLGEVLTTLEIEPDAAESNHCGACSRCLDICPTRAFIGPYKLDARRCVSYLTIENKGQIPRDLRPLLGNRIYGCDDCLAVCPWNKFAQGAREAAFMPRAALTAPKLAELVELDDAGFRALFSKSPVKRIGRARFIRNVLIAIGNSGEAALASAARERLRDESPLVRGAAVWALSRLSPALFERLRAEYARDEGDDDVRAEWAAGT